MKDLGIQMYSFMDGNYNDWKENIRIAKEIGYTGIELFGPCFDIPVEELKSLLNELSLEVFSLHEQSNKIIERTEYAKTLGLKYMGIGMETLRNHEEVLAFAKKLNELGQYTNQYGIMLTYHNHTQEYASFVEGKTIIETLIEETNPKFVGFEIDAGWCAAAGVNPIDFIKKYADRVKLIHIKESSEAIGPQPPMDFSGFEKDENGRPIFSDEVLKEMDRIKKINCLAGDGLVDWKKLKEDVEKAGCYAYYIVEREYSANDRVEALANDFKYYSSL